MIPSRVRITSKVSYEVVWIDSFKDEDQVGECRYLERQIVLKKSDKEPLSTYVHELLHAFSHEYNIGLTESQVSELEKAIKKFFKLNFK